MRLTGEEREARDTLVLRMYLAGAAYRDIGRRVSLSVGGVHKVITRQLRQSADLRGDTDGAVEAYLSRMEVLLAASWPMALRGDARATDQCRRVLDSMAKVQGLVPSVVERLLPDRLDAEDANDDEDGLDDLELYRLRREEKYGS